MAIASSQNRSVRNILFGPPSSRSIGRRYDYLGRNGISRRHFSYSVTAADTFCTIQFDTRCLEPFICDTTNAMKTVKGSVLHCGYRIKTRRKGWAEYMCVGRNENLKKRRQRHTRRWAAVRDHDCKAYPWLFSYQYLFILFTFQGPLSVNPI
jgi:hypothetical protein